MPLRGSSGGGVSGGAIILGADQARAFKEDDVAWADIYFARHREGQRW